MPVPLIGAALGLLLRSAILWLVGSLAKMFLYLLAFMVVRLFTLIGFSYVIYQGFDRYVNDFLLNIASQLNMLPDFIVHTLALAKFDVFISIILSAYALRFSIKGASKITLFG